MKKVLFAVINSKYIHTNLAVRYIKKYYEKYGTKKIDIKISEYTINNSLDFILEKIYLEKADYVFFSVYIWNVEYVIKIIKELKKINNEIKIGLGGPEVSYNSYELMEKYKEIDYIFSGEGERVFFNFFEKNLENIKGVYYKKENNIIFNGYEDAILNLDEIPFPYSDNEFDDNQIVYYESSRGCPFSCSYCMSSIDKRVRYFSIERVKKDLKIFIDKKVKLVKFVDRTYNLDKKRYFEIWKYLIGIYNNYTTFHFEISGDLFDDEVNEFLNKVPKEYFQFEVGVQTINTDTLKAINRKTNLYKLKENIQKIKDNIHLHLDLIAGLPYENYDSFKKSFNFVYDIKPEMVQLGFLKILKGTQIEKEIEQYDYKYREYPPYEIISNQFISYEEILKLKNIETILDYYYNSEKFVKSINFLCEKIYNKNYFNLYEDIAIYWKKNSYFDVGHKPIKYFDYLLEFYEFKNFEKKDIFLNYLKYDYFKLGKPGFFPDWLKRETDKERYEIEINKREFNGKREAYKKTEFEIFDFDVMNEREEKIEKIGIFFDY